MLALSPPLFSTIGWPLEDPMTLEHNYFHRDSSTDQTAESFLHILPSPHPPQFELDRSTTISGEYSGVSPIAKKLNHNASERDRRKKISDLYSSLRSLLPADQAVECLLPRIASFRGLAREVGMSRLSPEDSCIYEYRKLSIPNTISRVLKYIPELQKQVDGLIRKREELSARISKQEDQVIHEEKQAKSTARSLLSAVSTYRLNDREVTIQISTCNNHSNVFSEILQHLEEEGLQVQNASSFESSGGRVFYNLHLQVERTYRLECENLSTKLMSFYA